MTDTTFDADAIAAAEETVLEFDAGASIYRQDERADCAYIIRRGAVVVSEGGGIETIRPGEIFGEMALLENRPHTSSAVALGEIELIPITRALFLLLMRDDPDFARAIINLITRRVRAAMNSLERQPARRAVEEWATA
jgi:CRP/FNR family transcriptional regulator, cyclic AMP receptor protein